MKLKALLLGLAFLASLVPSASAQIYNIVNSRPGIAYNANSRTVVNNYVIKPEDHTVLVDCTTAAVTITLPPVSAKAYPYVVIKKIEVWCDGTNWFATLFTKIAAGGTFTQATP